MREIYITAEKELFNSIKTEKSFWKRLGKVIALNELLKKENY